MHLIFLYPYKAGQKEDIDPSARDPNLVYVLTENHRLHVLRATQPVRQKRAHLQKLGEYFLRYYITRNENFCILRQTYP